MPAWRGSTGSGETVAGEGERRVCMYAKVRKIRCDARARDRTHLELIAVCTSCIYIPAYASPTSVLVLIALPSRSCCLAALHGPHGAEPDPPVQTQDHVHFLESSPCAPLQSDEMRLAPPHQPRRNADQPSIPQLAVPQTPSMQRGATVIVHALYLCHQQISLFEECAHLQLIRRDFATLNAAWKIDG